MCGTPVPAILNPKNSIGLAGGAKNSQNFMQIGPKMATLQEKNPKMDPKNRFFLKNPPGF